MVPPGGVYESDDEGGVKSTICVVYWIFWVDAGGVAKHIDSIPATADRMLNQLDQCIVLNVK